eukprot:scaffold94473_cov22-Prasinocladus_malaysianus.AAC.2
MIPVLHFGRHAAGPNHAGCHPEPQLKTQADLPREMYIGADGRDIRTERIGKLGFSLSSPPGAPSSAGDESHQSMREPHYYYVHK